jgi:putative endonuclease
VRWPLRRSGPLPGPEERRQRLRRGRASEALAAAVLMSKGYLILGRRVKTRAGEIDIIAVRAKRLAFVEVKRRATPEDAEAAVSAHQAARIRRAADHWVAHRPRYHGHELAFDLILLVPGRWSRHIANGL